VSQMSPKVIPKEAKQAVETLLDAPEHYSYREIVKLVTENVCPISRQTIHRIKHARTPHIIKPLDEKFKKEPIYVTFSMNIEESLLEEIDAQRRRKSRAETVNRILEDWLNRYFANASSQILAVCIKRRDRFKGRRRKYERKHKTSFLINKTILARLKKLQTKIGEHIKRLTYDEDWLVQLVRPNSTMTLEDWIYTLKTQGLFREEKDEHKSFASIAEIVNAILHLELTARVQK